MRSDEQVKETLDHLETEEPLQEAGKGKANGHGNGNDTTPVVEWPAEGPIDLVADPHLTGVASVDVDCLPESLLAMVRAEGARLQVDPVHIAALAIGVCSAVMSDDWCVRLKLDDQVWLNCPRVWVCVVGKSGQKKTDSMRAATVGLLRIERRLRDGHEQAWAIYENELETWTALPKKERGPRPKKPVERRILSDDWTLAKLSDLLQASNKLLLRSDELATVLGAFDRHGNGGTINADRAHMLALYDGGYRRIDRVDRGNMVVKNWSAVPVGHIQPEKIRKLVNFLSLDGLLQRFMLVMPPDMSSCNDQEEDDVRSDWPAINHFAAVVELLFSMEPPMTVGPNGKPEHAIVQAGPGAQAIRRQLFRLIRDMETDPRECEPLKEASSKWRGLLARLALVFHGIELAEAQLAGRQLDPRAKLDLQASTVAKACKFITRIVVPSTIRFHTEIGSVSLKEAHARWIAGYVLTRNPPLTSITAREVGRVYRQLRGEPALIIAAMEHLHHAGWVQRDPERPHTKDAWLVNPAIYQAFAEQAATERARREENRRRLVDRLREAQQ